jgi:hypothetical protein
MTRQVFISSVRIPRKTKKAIKFIADLMFERFNLVVKVGERMGIPRESLQDGSYLNDKPELLDEIAQKVSKVIKHHNDSHRRRKVADQMDGAHEGKYSATLRFNFKKYEAYQISKLLPHD